MFRSAKLLVLVGLLAGTAHSLQAATIYPNALVDSQFTTSFGSGIVTGPPDGGGRFLGDTFDPPTNPGFIVVSFPAPLGNGPGIDLLVLDIGSSLNETANVFGSSDGVNFTLLAAINAVNNGIDFNGVFSGPVNFVRVANSSTQVSIDIDTLQGNYEFVATSVPEPASVVLWSLMTVAGIGSTWRRKRALV